MGRVAICKSVWPLALILCLVSADFVWASPYKPIPPSGNPVVDLGVGIVNGMNRLLAEIDKEADMLLRKAKHIKELSRFQDQANEWIGKLGSAGKEVRQKQFQLKKDHKAELRKAKSKSEESAINAKYKQKQEQLASSASIYRDTAKKARYLHKKVGATISLLRRVKRARDWVDPKTGTGRIRRLFHKSRQQIRAVSGEIATQFAAARALERAGGAGVPRHERFGAFELRIKGLRAKSNFEFYVNDALATEGKVIPISNGRKIRVVARVVGERRKQSRELKNKPPKVVRVKTANDHVLDYGTSRMNSRWEVVKESYDWKVSSRTGRPFDKNISASGIHPNVKNDELVIEFAADTASETFTLNVGGECNWEMDGRRNGKPVADTSDESAVGAVSLVVSPGR